MHSFPKKLTEKIQKRKDQNSYRVLPKKGQLIDFSSNDYIGFAGSKEIFDKIHLWLQEQNIHVNGATGSRLISGNHDLYTQVEKSLEDFHESESALLFNSGYDANVGLFSSVPQRGDIVLYDELIHASIRDGISMGIAKSYKFRHNDIVDLQKKVTQLAYDNQDRKEQVEVYVVTESVFSMDGDSPDLIAFVELCEKNNCHLIIDEAHAVGVFGNQGKGLIQHLGIQDRVFARVNTFGKAIGCHGAAVLGSKDLKSYLVNFARSFIYTTGLSPHSLASIGCIYNELQSTYEIEKLRKNIICFNDIVKELGLQFLFIESNSAIHCCVIEGNKQVIEIAKKIQNKGFDVKPILSPTVAKGKERLRFCIHSYNSEEEIYEVLNILATFVNYE